MLRNQILTSSVLSKAAQNLQHNFSVLTFLPWGVEYDAQPGIAFYKKGVESFS